MKDRKYEINCMGDYFTATYFENYGSGWKQLFQPEWYDFEGLKLDFCDILSESDFEKMRTNAITKLIYEF